MSMSLAGLLRWRFRSSLNAFRELRSHSRLKVVFIAVSAALIWLGIFFAAYEGLAFMDKADYSGTVKAVVVDFMLSSFFLALLVLLTFSNAVITYGSLFRSRETTFLVSSPLAPGPLFAYRLTEGILFSSWAFLFLGLPIILAIGLNLRSPLVYYPGALVFFGAFTIIPAVAGGLIALVVARYFAGSPRRLLTLIVVLVAVIFGYWALAVTRDLRFGAAKSVDVWVSNVLGKLSFTQNAFLPSYWVSSGVIAMTRGEIGKAAYYFELILANGLFFGMVGWAVADRAYLPGYHISQSATRRSRFYADNAFDRLLMKLMFGVPRPVRLLVIKDVKTFRRDVTQWSQVSIFFGLLAVYLLNIRRFHYDQTPDVMRNLVSFLNLGATSLTLSTFTTRFIFPLLSLEGRNFWTLGLLPLERKRILQGKFLFSFGGSLIISEALMVLSDYMLRTPLPMMILHMYVVFVVCAGLSGLAVGLGALYPNLREENPSKIVSGFGGSLNLMISMFYLVIVIALFAVPCHIAFLGFMSGWSLRAYLLVATGLSILLGACAVVIPLKLGARAFERLEP